MMEDRLAALTTNMSWLDLFLGEKWRESGLLALN